MYQYKLLYKLPDGVGMYCIQTMCWSLDATCNDLLLMMKHAAFKVTDWLHIHWVESVVKSGEISQFKWLTFPYMVTDELGQYTTA